MGEFVAGNMLGWFKKINKRKICCILLAVYMWLFFNCELSILRNILSILRNILRILRNILSILRNILSILRNIPSMDFNKQFTYLCIARNNFNFSL